MFQLCIRYAVGGHILAIGPGHLVRKLTFCRLFLRPGHPSVLPSFFSGSGAVVMTED